MDDTLDELALDSSNIQHDTLMCHCLFDKVSLIALDSP